MVVDSTRTDIVVEQDDNGATLTVFARNPIVSWVVLPAGAFVSLWPAILVAYGISVSNYGTVFVMGGLTAIVWWLTWRLGWRARPFRIAFSREFVQAGKQRVAYSDIRSCGLTSNGGDLVDTVSIGVPRNVTIGLHVYVETSKRQLPITVGLKEAQAREALRIFSRLLDEYRSV